MYLPVILIRHWGWAGFLAFAIPNVLGCAGFGYACRRVDSERLCREHAGALALFSAVTIAYQVFFVAWMARSFAPASATVPPTWLAALAILAVGLLLSLGRGGFWPWLGSVAALVSLSLWLALPSGLLAGVPAGGDMTNGSLILALPIVVFGFLLSPWLDRTFHRARQESPSVHSFGVFGVSFAGVILLTAAYGASGEAFLTRAVVVHMAVQATFTVAAHARELRVAPVPRGQRWRQAALVLPALVGAGAASVPVAPETIYLLFLGFYALLFPGYVVLFMRPSVPSLGPGTPRALGVVARPWPRTSAWLAGFAILVLLAAPFAALGFLERKTWLLPIPVVMLVVAALFGPRAHAVSTPEEPSRERESATPPA